MIAGIFCIFWNLHCFQIDHGTMPGEMGELPNLALIGAGLFVRGQYIPRLRQAVHLLTLKIIWSRTEVII